MRKIAVIFLWGALALVPSFVFAFGGGGGGSFFSQPAPVVEPTPAPAPATSSASTIKPEVPASTPAPAPAVVATPVPRKLWCNQILLANRIRCRLGLSKAELEEELAQQYLPEECRPLTSGKKETCVARYRALQPCWKNPVGLERSRCAAEKLELKGTIAAQLKECLKKQGADRAVCQAAVRDKVFAMIKFRLYDLSERAEDLIEKGVSRDVVGDLVVAMETNKQTFNGATSYAARQKILNNARASWKKFVAKTKGKEKVTDYLDQAFTDLKNAR